MRARIHNYLFLLVLGHVSAAHAASFLDRETVKTGAMLLGVGVTTFGALQLSRHVLGAPYEESKKALQKQKDAFVTYVQTEGLSRIEPLKGIQVGTEVFYYGYKDSVETIKLTQASVDWLGKVRDAVAGYEKITRSIKDSADKDLAEFVTKLMKLKDLEKSEEYSAFRGGTSPRIENMNVWFQQHNQKEAYSFCVFKNKEAATAQYKIWVKEDATLKSMDHSLEGFMTNADRQAHRLSSRVTQFAGMSDTERYTFDKPIIGVGALSAAIIGAWRMYTLFQSPASA